jgi:hypothetical protein
MVTIAFKNNSNFSYYGTQKLTLAANTEIFKVCSEIAMKLGTECRDLIICDSQECFCPQGSRRIK